MIVSWLLTINDSTHISKKNAFEPALVAIIEEKLNNEKLELELHKLEYSSIENTDNFSC
jgi:hypothetical protein